MHMFISGGRSDAEVFVIIYAVYFSTAETS